MATLEELMKEAESLSRDDREFLAAHLFATLEDDRDPGYEEAWAAEIERRVRELDEGTAETMTLDDALSELRRHLG